MVKDITTWIREELYPVLFLRIDMALPEHNWNKDGRGWKSKTRLDGSPYEKDRSDKTKILKAQPGYIFEEGGDRKSLVTYVMDRDGLSFIDAVRKLASVASLPVPPLDVKDQEAYRTAQQRSTLMEEATSYMSWSLLNATGKKADAVREYLQGRGWTMEEVEAVGLGYLPSWEQLKAYLLGKGYTDEAIGEALTIGQDGRLGTTHTLAIPYRSGSRILGYAFRTVTGAEPKYLNSTGMDRKAGLFNLSPLKGTKDLVVVEGYLDALHATAKGLENVVAVSSSHLGPEHIQDAVAKGARAVTLCFDPDEAGKKGTDHALEVLKAFPRLKVYVAELPAGADGGKMDPDQLIRDQGVDALQAVIAGAIPAWEYELGQLLEPFGEKDLQPKEVDQLIQRAIVTGNDIADPIDRDRFFTAFRYQVEGLGVTKESLLGAQEQLRYERDREHQRKALEKVIRSASKDLEGGDPGAAVDRLEGSLQQLRRERGSTLLHPATYSGWLDHMGKSLPALRTGYAALDAVARIPQAAITLVAGRPRHGKTTVMMNLLLSMAELYPTKRFLFFTYEEPSAHILTKLLNRTLGVDLTAHYQYEEASTNYSYLGAYLRSGRTDVAEIETAKEKLRDLMESGRIQVIDGNYTVEDLRAILEAIPAEEVGAVFLDYIQRMSTAKQTQDKRTEIAHISDQLLQIAKGTGLPLILGAQLNRAGASSTDKRPSLENLKEAGNLEEDANLVLSVYNESAEKEAADGGTWGREVTLELRALKNRDGAPNKKAELTLDSLTGKVKEGAAKW
jgi:DNA primase catalytic core